MNQNREDLKIYSDSKLRTFSENYLLEYMGLSCATDKDLDELLYPELNDFIANNTYLSS
jgi:hypothetical protein